MPCSNFFGVEDSSCVDYPESLWGTTIPSCHKPSISARRGFEVLQCLSQMNSKHVPASVSWSFRSLFWAIETWLALDVFWYPHRVCLNFFRK